jgi:phospholipid/cholesterol/gamma-HCH transport system ATP-binding protein
MSAAIEMIRFAQVLLPESAGPVSFAVQGGDMTVLVTPRDEASTVLIRLLIGLDKPQSGAIFLFGTDISTLSGRELINYRRRIGVSFKTGGLVSNLKVWENLLLPLSYHQNPGEEELRQRGLNILDRIGFTGQLMALPGHLSASRRKLVGVARAMIMTPEVIIYEAPLSGLNLDEKAAFFRIAREFHRELPGRASLFVTANRDVVRSVPEAVVIDLTKGQFI